MCHESVTSAVLPERSHRACRTPAPDAATETAFLRGCQPTCHAMQGHAFGRHRRSRHFWTRHRLLSPAAPARPETHGAGKGCRSGGGGGKVRSSRRDGFTFDWGPNGFLNERARNAGSGRRAGPLRRTSARVPGCRSALPFSRRGVETAAYLSPRLPPFGPGLADQLRCGHSSNPCWRGVKSARKASTASSNGTSVSAWPVPLPIRWSWASPPGTQAN